MYPSLFLCPFFWFRELSLSLQSRPGWIVEVLYPKRIRVGLNDADKPSSSHPCLHHYLVLSPPYLLSACPQDISDWLLAYRGPCPGAPLQGLCVITHAWRLCVIGSVRARSLALLPSLSVYGSITSHPGNHIEIRHTYRPLQGYTRLASTAARELC